MFRHIYIYIYIFYVYFYLSIGPKPKYVYMNCFRDKVYTVRHMDPEGSTAAKGGFQPLKLGFRGLGLRMRFCIR